MDGRKNRGRRKRRSRTSVHQSGEPDDGPTLDTGNILTSSQSDNGTDSSNGVGGDTVNSGLDNSILVRSKWETYPTPPMETSSSTEQVVIPTSDLPPDHLTQQENMGLHTEPDKQFSTPVNEHHESTVSNDLNMSEEVSLLNNAGEHTPKQAAHRVEEDSLQETGEASCDIFTENGFVPIHLPLSSELYTPAYCVHATDQCELETPDKSDLVPAESKSFMCENGDDSGLPLTTLHGERDHIERLEDSSEIDITNRSENEIPTELIETGVSVLPKVQPGINNEGAKVCLLSTTPSLYVCAGSEEETVDKPERNKGRPADNTKRAITKVSSDLRSPVASTEKKRWKPNFSWLKGDLKLASGTYEPEVMLPKSQIYPAQDKGENHLVSVTLKPDDEPHQQTGHTAQKNSEREITSRRKKVKQDRPQTKTYSLSCIESQKKRNKLEDQQNEKGERTQSERKSKRGKKRKMAPDEPDNATESREVQERKISLAMKTASPATQHQHIKQVDEKIFTEGELNQLITDVQMETQQENNKQHLKLGEEEVRDATIKRQKNEAWLKTATMEAFRDIEAEINEKESETEKQPQEKSQKKPAIKRTRKQKRREEDKQQATQGKREVRPSNQVGLRELIAEEDGNAQLDAPDFALKKPKFGFSFWKKAKKPKAVAPGVQVPGAGVDASVSLPAVDTSVSGAVELPNAEVSMPAKKRGFGFGFGSKGKGAKKVAKPEIAAAAGADVSLDADVRLPEVSVDVAADVDGTGKAGAKGRGFKFPWSPKIKLGKGKLGKGDFFVETPVSSRPPKFSDSSPRRFSRPLPASSFDALSSSVGTSSPALVVCEPFLSVSVSRPDPFPLFLPSVHSAVDDNLFSSVDADLILSDIPLGELSTPSPCSLVSETIVSQSIGDVVRRDISVSASPATAIPEAFADVAALSSSEPFAFPNASVRLDLPDSQCFNNVVPLDVAVAGPNLALNTQGSSPLTNSRDDLFVPAYSPNLSVSQELKFQPPGEPIDRHEKFCGLRLHGHPKPAPTRDQLYKQAHEDVSPTRDEIQVATKPCADELFDPSSGHIHPLDFSITDGEASEMESSYNKQTKVDRGRSNFSLPRVFGSLVRRKHRSPADVRPTIDQSVDKPAPGAHPDESVDVKKKRRPKKSRSGPKRSKRPTKDATITAEIGKPNETPLTPRTPSGKPKDLYSRQTWHGDDEFRRLSRDEMYNLEFGEPPQVPPTPTGFRITPVLRDPGNIMDVRRRSTTDSAKRRPWSTVGLPPPGCKFVNDDYLFPDALTPTKIPSFRGSREIVYNVPYMDDQALPLEEPEWPIGESRRTLLSQLSQTSEGMVHIAAEEESSIISLDDKENRFKDTSEKPSRVSLLFARKSRSKSKKADTCEPHEQSTSHSRHSAKLALKLNRPAQSQR